MGVESKDTIRVYDGSKYTYRLSLSDLSEEVKENLENKMDMEIQAEKLECIFRDEILSKIAGALTYTEKLVLSLYYIENKSDEEISNILFLTKSGITKKRNRALEKIRREFEKRRHF